MTEIPFRDMHGRCRSAEVFFGNPERKGVRVYSDPSRALSLKQSVGRGRTHSHPLWWKQGLYNHVRSGGDNGLRSPATPTREVIV